jgi:hypothetical protein
MYETKPVESPAERTPGVVDTILSMPAPPLLKQMMIAESIPMSLPWALPNSPSVLGVCSRQPPHCIAAARILRKILALRNVRSHAVRGVNPRLRVSFQRALFELREHPQSAPNVVHAWLEAASDLVLAVPRADGNADSNAAHTWPDWWPAFDRRDWAALGKMSLF